MSSEKEHQKAIESLLQQNQQLKDQIQQITNNQ